MEFGRVGEQFDASELIYSVDCSVGRLVDCMERSERSDVVVGCDLTAEAEGETVHVAVHYQMSSNAQV